MKKTTSIATILVLIFSAYILGQSNSKKSRISKSNIQRKSRNMNGFSGGNSRKKTVLPELNDEVLVNFRKNQTKPKTSTRKKTKRKPIKRKIKTLFDEKESKKAKVVWKERSKVKSKK